MNKNLKETLEKFEIYLREYMDSINCHPLLKEAMSYSLLAGGKRIRPMLMFASAKICDIGFDEIKDMALSMEMIHTYSLIHDDLPSMDNDDYRRGKLTSHKKFGEAFAILAGDALLNEAHTVLLDKYSHDRNSSKAATYISKEAGRSGMINGQVIDIYNEDKVMNINDLKEMHSYKTGAIIKASIVAPFIMKGCNQEKIENAEKLGDELGILFQIQDDILDSTSDFKTLGKSTGKDEANNKSTYVTLLGLDESRKKLIETYENITRLISDLNAESSDLSELIESIYRRNN